MDPSLLFDPSTIFTVIVFLLSIYFFRTISRRMPSRRDITAPPKQEEKPEELIQQLGPEIGRFTDYPEVLSNLEGEKNELVEKGLNFRQNSNFAEAVDAFDACLDLENTPSELTALHILIGNCMVGQKDRTESLEHFQTALDIADENNDLTGRLISLRNIGLYYEARGDGRRAREHLEDALALSQDYGRVEDEIIELGNLGRLHFRQENKAKSLEYAQQAMRLYSNDDLRIDRACALGNLGVVYRARGDVELAIEHLEQSLEFSRKSNFKAGEAASLGNLGYVHSDMGELDKALEHHEAALALFEEIKAKDQISGTKESIAQLHKKLPQNE